MMLVVVCFVGLFFFFKQKTAYEMRISDWSSDVCSSDLSEFRLQRNREGGLWSSDRLVTMPCGVPKQREHEDQTKQRRKNAEQKQGEIGRATCRESVCQYV